MSYLILVFYNILMVAVLRLLEHMRSSSGATSIWHGWCKYFSWLNYLAAFKFLPSLLTLIWCANCRYYACVMLDSAQSRCAMSASSIQRWSHAWFWKGQSFCLFAPEVQRLAFAFTWTRMLTLFLRNINCVNTPRQNSIYATELSKRR